MSSRSRNNSNKKWMLVAFSVVGAGLLFLVSSLESGDESSLSGTMTSRSAVSLENMEAAWAEAAALGSNRGHLDGVFEATIEAANATRSRLEHDLGLYFSRDENFDSETDCLVDQRSVTLEASSSASVQFRSKARLVDCLDAGPWYAAVRSADGTWHALESVYHVANGEAEVALEMMDSAVAPRSEMDVQLRIHRPMTVTGYDGLHEFPVDVWLEQGETLCLIESKKVSVERDPAAQQGQRWNTTLLNLTLSLKDAKKVDRASMQTSPFSMSELIETGRDCINCTPPKLEGSCRLSEGSMRVVVGPTDLGFKTILETYHHASPVVVETGVLEVSVRAGEVVHVTRTAYNPSLKEVAWNTESELHSDWLVGMQDQSLAARKPSTVGFTVSATDLAPGVYEGEIVVSVSDYYGTQSVVKTRVTVLPGRKVVSEESSSDLPISFALGNYPNPFNPSTTIRFELNERGRASLEVFDVSGRRVQVLHEGDLSQGVHEFRFNADNLPSGTYLYRLTTPTATKTETMTLVK